MEKLNFSQNTLTWFKFQNAYSEGGATYSHSKALATTVSYFLLYFRE